MLAIESCTITNYSVSRNVCPVHSNIKRMASCLKKNLGLNLPTSARLLCGLLLCGKAETNVLEPLTWPIANSYLH